jgi:hypothetical protein
MEKKQDQLQVMGEVPPVIRLQTDGSHSLNIHLHLLSKSFSWHLSEPKIGIILYDFYKVYNLNIKS